MKKLAAFLGLAAMTLGTVEARAWAPLDGTYPRWPQMPVTYYVNQASIPPSIAAIGVARLDQGFASWGAPNCTTFATKNLGNTQLLDNTNDSTNVLRWQSGSWPAQFGDVNSVIGVTLPVFDGSGTIFDADITFNNVGFCWNDNGLNNCVDTLSIATHEQGHFLGLDHSSVSGSTMEPFYGGGNSIASLEQDDMDGVCALYPTQGMAISSSSGGGGMDCNTCANQTSQGACSSQFQACGSSQDCLNYYNCIGKCQDQACVNQCANQFPAGASIYGKIVDCACMYCAVECSQLCGGSGGSSSSTSGNGASSGGGGNGGQGGSTGAWSSDDEDPPVANPQNDGSCSCSMEPAPLRFSAFLGAGALVLAFARRRTRRSSRR